MKKWIIHIFGFPVHIKVILQIAIITPVHRQASYTSSHSTSEHLNDKANITRPKVRNTVTVGTTIPHFHQTENQHGITGPSYTLEQLDLIDITWPIYPSAVKYTFFSRAQNSHQIRAHVRTQTGLFLKSLYWLCYNIAAAFFFNVLFFWPRGMWDRNSLTGGQTSIPCIGRLSLN